MTTVLVVHPGMPAFRQQLARAHAPLLAELGLELVLADEAPVASDRECFADVLALPPAEEVGANLAALEPWLRGRRVGAVLAQSESGLALGSLVAQRLGLPGMPPAAALLTTDKHACRVRLAEARVDEPRFALARSAADVRAFAHAHGYPVVLKGAASALGRLVTLVREERAVEGHVARLLAALPRSRDIRRLVTFTASAGLAPSCDPTHEFLVESFARGAALECDGLVARDAIHSFGVTGQVLSAPPLFYMEGYLLPADRDAAELRAAELSSAAALRALGVRDTGYSTEMRSADGRALVIEVNGRLGWDEGFGDLFAVRTGAHPVFQTLQIALGKPPEKPLRSGTAAALAYRSWYADGIVSSIPAAAEVEALAAQHGVRAGIAVQRGDRLHAPPHHDVRPHLAWALATDARSSRAAFARARAAVAALSVEVAPLPAGDAEPARTDPGTAG